MSSHSPSRLNAFLAVFILSGFAGLIYQSIWSHYLGLFLGHAAYAQALVLAIFMGGMAAGAALVARVGAGWGGLIRRYALIEAIIGVLALLFHWVFTGLLGFSYDTVIPALGNPTLINTYKWLLAGLLILPQSILLGMTFPLMSGGIIRRFPGANGSVLGGLYFTNSIGAAIGVLCSGFLILPLVGLDGAVLVAGSLNLLVAFLAWLLAGRQVECAPASVKEPQAAAQEQEGRPLLKVVLLATFFSGAASFAYEIIWIRMLSLAVGSTLHAFELMLAAFIAGIAFGGLWIRKRADQSKDPLRLVGWMQVLMGLAALLSLVFYAQSFEWVEFLVNSLTKTDGGYSLFNLATGVIAVLIMLPAAFFAGTTLPLFTVVLLRDGQGESSIGRVYAWNTLGAILGVFAAIHLLIPGLGLKMALIVSALVDMVIGLALLRLRTVTNKDLSNVGLGAGLVLLSTVLVVSLVPFDLLRLSSGVYRSGNSSLNESVEILFYQDGKTASVSSTFWSKSGLAAIATNGKTDAAIQMKDGNVSPDEPTMVLAAALPLAYQPEIKKAGVIGFGSGLSTHVLLSDQRLQQVDTIEIEQQMIEGAKVFAHRVERAYNDPRSNIVIDDAKSYFASQPERYDLILSEPSNPWISGVGALFSKEFYEFVPQFLAEDGIFLQWLQLYEIDERLVGSVLNALAPSFKDYHAYLASNGDLLIVASNSPLTKNPDFVGLFNGELQEELKRVGVTDPAQLKFRQVADAQVIRAWARLYKAEANSDYYPVLSLNAPRTRFKSQSADQIIGLPSASLPVLEAFGVTSRLPADVGTGIHGHFSRADMLAQARAAKDALTGQYQGLPFSQTVTAMLEASAVSECATPWSAVHEQLALKNLLLVAETTLAYLSTEEQQGVLIQPVWLECKQLPATFAQFQTLLEAAALRDDAQVAALAEQWFAAVKEQPAYYRTVDPLVFGLWQLALIRMEQYAQAQELEHSVGNQVSAVGDYGQIRSLILAWLDEVQAPKQ